MAHLYLLFVVYFRMNGKPSMNPAILIFSYIFASLKLISHYHRVSRVAGAAPSLPTRGHAKHYAQCHCEIGGYVHIMPDTPVGAPAATCAGTPGSTASAWSRTPSGTVQENRHLTSSRTDMCANCNPDTSPVVDVTRTAPQQPQSPSKPFHQARVAMHTDGRNIKQHKQTVKENKPGSTRGSASC